VYDPSLGSHVEVRNFHWSEVRSKAKVAPKYPSEAKKLGINGRCQVRFLIDGSGNQVNLELLETDDCPPVFHKNTLKAANRWRFKPLEADGIAVRATFVLGLRFIAK
jgi:protein TonB